jgi:alpha-tubulin suppressor-like RCC1 family protein
MVSAIKYDNTLWTWGRNVYGQLGINSTNDMSSPVQEITLSSNWLQTSCSGEGTGAIKTDGTLWLWGRNYGGQLAQNLDFLTLDAVSSPVQIYGGGTNWSKLSFGLGFNAGALKADGTIWLWGNNYFGQCGVNEDSNSYSSPVQEITGSTNWADVSLGAYFTAALKKDGTIWCWGQNYAGTLGDNTAIDKSSPVQEFTASTWLSVSAGVNYVLAIKNNNTLWTWGANYDGQLGISGDLNTPVSVATQIGTENTWIYASAGDAVSFGIKSDGSLWSWGLNQDGELGLDNNVPCSSPIQVPSLAGFWTWAEGESAGIRTVPIPTPTPT